jgi:hypothetical protein
MCNTKHDTAGSRRYAAASSGLGSTSAGCEDDHRDAGAHVSVSVGGFWRLSQPEGSDLLDRLGERQSFAGAVVELGRDPLEVHRAVD